MSTFNKGQRNSISISSNSNNNNNKSHDGKDDQKNAISARRAQDATMNIQDDTQASLARTLAAATETTELGVTTLDELYQQRKTLERTREAGDRLNVQLDKTEKLQNTLSRLGGWNHWGKRSEAKKLVQQDLKMEQQQQAAANDERKQSQRKEQHDDRMTKNATTPSSSVSSSSRTSPSHDDRVVVVKKKKSLLGRKMEKLSVVSVSAADRKALGSSTYGFGKNNRSNNNNDKEHDEFLRRVEATDQEIDVGLNAVDAQLDQLLDLAASIKDEVQVQSSVLEHVNDQLQTAHQKQKVAAHRMGRFV